MVYKMKYSLLGTIALVTPAAHSDQGIVIQSISKFDNLFFTADTIEILRKYQRAMIAIINGDRAANGTYHGKYSYKNNAYGAHDLATIEQQLEAQKATLSTQVYEQEKKALKDLLLEVMYDFKGISHEFEAIIRDAKAMVAEFVKESCLQRNRTDSLLIRWLDTQDGKEFDVFKKEADTLIKFDQFCVDLLNFFNDLVRSCPKAKQAFDLRVTKWKKVREAVDALKKSGRTFDENSFLKYVKKTVLDSLAIHAITTELMVQLLEKFEQ